MQFLTQDEAREAARWFAGGADVDDPRVLVSKLPSIQVVFEKEQGYRYFWVAQKLVDALDYFDSCLLWVVQTGVWRSNENWHLYDALRRSFGETSDLEQRPALKARRHETAGLVSFVHLGCLSGWDMILLPSDDYGRVWISHDGWAEVGFSNGELRAGAAKSLQEAKLEVTFVGEDTGT
jgi:hypothetical protein